MSKNLLPGQVVDVGEERGIVVESTQIEIAPNEILVWFGRFAPDGSLDVFTVLVEHATICRDAAHIYR